MDKSRLLLSPGIWLDARRAVWFETERVLAVADLHLGYAWASRHGGQLLPVSAPETVLPRLLELQASYRPCEIVLLGDIVHRAVPLPKLKRDLKEFCEQLRASGQLRWIAGNHDHRLDQLFAACNLKARLEAFWRVGPHFLLHGDDDAAAEKSRAAARRARGRVFVGHEHPAIALGDGVTTGTKVPCFLVSDSAVVLPAFSEWAAGAAVGRHGFMSRFARKSSFHCAVGILGNKLLPVPLN